MVDQGGELDTYIRICFKKPSLNSEKMKITRCLLCFLCYPCRVLLALIMYIRQNPKELTICLSPMIFHCHGTNSPPFEAERVQHELQASDALPVRRHIQLGLLHGRIQVTTVMHLYPNHIKCDGSYSSQGFHISVAFIPAH